MAFAILHTIVSRPPLSTESHLSQHIEVASELCSGQVCGIIRVDLVLTVSRPLVDIAAAADRLPYTQQKRGIHPMLYQCWTSVEDGGPTLKEHWVNTSCLLGISVLSRESFIRLSSREGEIRCRACTA